MPARSEEKAQFYDDIMITLFDGNYGAVELFGLGEVFVAMPSKNIYSNLVFDSDGYVEFHYYDEPETHIVNADTIAHAFTLINGVSDIDSLGPATRKAYRKSYTENDAGDIDAVDATNILEIGLFGEIVYG